MEGMKGHENLKPFDKRTKDEQRKIAQKGGNASGKSRRRKKAMKELFRSIGELALPPSKVKAQMIASGIAEEDATYAAGLVYAAYGHAMKGNSQMMRLAFEMMGEDPALKLKQKELNLKRKEMKSGAGGKTEIHVYIPDNGRD